MSGPRRCIGLDTGRQESNDVFLNHGTLEPLLVQIAEILGAGVVEADSGGLAGNV